jgi:hypothetical protein
MPSASHSPATTTPLPTDAERQHGFSDLPNIQHIVAADKYLAELAVRLSVLDLLGS